ncbi:choline transporter-like protein 1 isoform X2 [Lineus longissimus]|uniref:choline transporter-like protein 1 isoform X2 n=1 Tax=Lineus longissimus TaxID=88925 RepID=UPI002B4F797A
MGCCGGPPVPPGTRIQPVRTNGSTVDPDIQEEDDFDGPLNDRSCRDVVFLILLIACLGGMGYVGYLGVMSGNPNRLLFGVDSWGNVCNQPNTPIPNATNSGKDMTGLMNTFYYSFPSPIDPLVSQIVQTDNTVMCVRTCPGNSTMLTPADYADFATTSNSRVCFYDLDPSQYSLASISSGQCPTPPVLPHVSVLNRCVPKNRIDAAAAVAGAVTSILDTIDNDFTDKFVQDVETGWKEVCYLAAISSGVALFIVVVMRFIAAILIWTMYVLLILACLGGMGYCWYNWYTIQYAEVVVQETAKTWLAYAAIATAVGLVILLILLIMRKRLALVVQLFREAGNALGKMPLLLIQPLWTFLSFAAIMGGIGYIFLYVLTSSQPVVSQTGKVTFKDDELLFYLKWYFIFGALWVMNFILACQEVVIAGAVATWYFTRDKKNKLGWPIARSTGRLIRYHLGSVAFGSFIIAVVMLARLILAYIQKKLHGRGGPIVQFLLKCLQCCLWCFEKFLKFLNRNAYIEIAIYGYNFCKAAAKAFSLIVSNALRVAAINSVGDFVLLMGKLMVVAITICIGFVLVKDNQELNYVWVPLLLGGLASFVISHCFLSVYEMCIDTIFLCFCEDSERNDGITKPYYMSKNLMTFVENSRKAIEAREKYDAANKAVRRGSEA